MRIRAAVYRLIAASIMLVAAWAIQLMSAAVIFRIAPSESLTWAHSAAISCLAGVLLIGLPLAVLNPSSYMEERLQAILLVATGIGILGMFAPLGIFAAPISFVSGAFAMWSYLIVLAEYPETFGVPKRRTTKDERNSAVSRAH